MITTGDYHIPEHVSNPARDLVTKILNTNPNERITIEQIKSHEWYTMNGSETLRIRTERSKRLEINDNVVHLVENHFNGKYSKDHIKYYISKNGHNTITST